MEEPLEPFLYDQLGSGKDQFDSFYDFRENQLDSLIQIWIARSYKESLNPKKLHFLRISDKFAA